MLTVLLVLLIAQIIYDLLDELHEALQICKNYARIRFRELVECLLVLITLGRLALLMNNIETVLDCVQRPSQVSHEHLGADKVLGLSLEVSPFLVDTLVALLPVHLLQPLVDFGKNLNPLEE